MTAIAAITRKMIEADREAAPSRRAGRSRRPRHPSKPAAAASTAPSQSSSASCGLDRACSIAASWSAVTGPEESPER